MSLKNSLERLKAAMRPSQDNSCPPSKTCYDNVDGQCFEYTVFYQISPINGKCIEVNRRVIQFSKGPCTSKLPMC